MTEPISSASATTALTAVSVLALSPGLDPATVLGAFAGASVFVISSSELTWLKRLGFFVVSFLCGLLGARMVAGLIDGLLPDAVEVADGVGALVAAAVAIKLLLWLIKLADNPADLLNKIKGGQ